MSSTSAIFAANWKQIVSLRLSSWGIDLNLGVLFFVLVIILLVASSVGRRGKGRWKVSSADFNFAGCATVTLCPTDDVARLAHQAWVELTTRKAAIPYDNENDVIVEIYDSWYSLFKSLRELTKGIPVSKGMRKDSDEAKLVDALSGALNEGLRPHLTKWQARFRRWYASALEDPQNAHLSPQEIQEQFPDYEALVQEIRVVNSGLVKFAEALRIIAHERVREPWWHFGVVRSKISPNLSER